MSKLNPNVAILDLESEGRDEALPRRLVLDFSDPVPPMSGVSTHYPGNEQVHSFSNFPDSPGSDEEWDERQPLTTEAEQPQKAGPSFWTFEYYQKFFDVDTKQVMDRIVWSMIPRPGISYLQHYIRPKPDLYGPFWICVTLVFTMAVAGNLANYLQTAASGTYKWKYDFHKVTIAATAIFSYAWLVPLALWGVVWWLGSQARLSFLEIVCIYGYSLAIYVPVSILWVIQINIFQWLLVVIGALLSGVVLITTVWPALQGERKQFTIIVAAVVLLLHLLLAVCFKVYFFHIPTRDHAMSTTVKSYSTLEMPSTWHS